MLTSTQSRRYYAYKYEQNCAGRPHNLDQIILTFLFMDPLVVVYLTFFALTGIFLILGLHWRNDRILKYSLASMVVGTGTAITWQMIGGSADGEFEILDKKKTIIIASNDGFVAVAPDIERMIKIVNYKDVKAILDGAEVFLVTKHYPQIGRDITRQELEFSQPEQCVSH